MSSRAPRSVWVLGAVLGSVALVSVVAARSLAEERTTSADTRLLPQIGIASIKQAEARKHVYFLAGKKCEGRAAGLPGCDVAGEYLIERVKEYGLKPAGEDGTYKQFFDVTLLAFPGQPPPRDVKLGTSAKTFNVAAVLEGSDPELKKEYLVLTAHYDHTGPRSKKKYYPGSDDNASGTATLLEVAQAFVTEDVPLPKRSILFLWVSGEERGLLGSKHYVSKPTVPLADVVCNLNMDMVGRNPKDPNHVYGNASSPDLDAAHAAAMEVSGLEFIAKTGSIFQRSDQYNFYLHDIPCLFWTSGLHKDYHGTKDLPNRIAYKQIEKMGKHIFATAWEVANKRERPRFVKMDKAGSAGRLGAVLIMLASSEVPETKLGDEQGLALVNSVMEDMPAFEAGLEQGDMIIGLDGKDLPDHDPVGAIEDAAAGAKTKITLRVFRKGKRIKITVKF